MSSKVLSPAAGLEVAASTLKASAMQFVAISIESASSGAIDPSVDEVFKKSIMAKARRFLVSSGADCLG